MATSQGMQMGNAKMQKKEGKMPKKLENGKKSAAPCLSRRKISDPIRKSMREHICAFSRAK